MKLTSKKGFVDLQFNNLIEILLTLILFSILILFISSQYYKIPFLEKNYAKNIALLIDNVRPGMKVYFDMSEAFKIAESNGVSPQEIVKVERNRVLISLANNQREAYSFFNDVNFIYYPEYKEGYTGNYIFEIKEYVQHYEKENIKDEDTI